jgi:hypothetical protein
MTQASRSGNKKGNVLVQERDRRLLRELSLFRIIDREQAKVVAGFHSTTRANSRLLALTKAGLLKRFFIGTTAGGKKALYYLSSAGANLVQVQNRSPRRRADEVVVMDFFVNHQLGINEIYGMLKYHPIPIDGATFVRWEAFYQPIDIQRSLIPDGYVEIQTPAKPIAAFLEYDLGHENLTVWKAKTRSYLRYAKSGEFERAFHQPQFRVLVVATSDRRVEAIRRAVGEITDKIFWFCTMDALRHEKFWSASWLRPRSNQEPVPLL